MKNQEFKRVDNDALIRIVSDTPFIRINYLADKMGIPLRTIRGKVYELIDDGKLFVQKRSNHVHLVTTHYAKKHYVSPIYVEQVGKSTLELQLMFNRLAY